MKTLTPASEDARNVRLKDEKSDAEFSARISRLCEVVGGYSAMARLIDSSDSAVGKWCRGETDPSRSFIIAIARACGITVQWLATGEGPMRIDEAPEGLVPESDPEFVYVKRYNVRASGGNGEFICEENAVGRYAYERDWWHRTMPCEPADCAIIYCDGRSMEPDILDGDPIMLTTADRGLRTDAVYVFRLGERLLVKRLQFLPGGKINVISINKEDYPPYQIDQETLESPEQGAVIGKVFGVPGGFRWIK